ncbi:MAG: hypothetical protein AAF384_04585 [Pseudomonadota bacterium]
MTTTEKIKVQTEAGQMMEVAVLSKRANAIEVLVGEGTHSVKCELTPSRNGAAYVGNVMGREIIYQKKPEEIQAELDAQHSIRGSRPNR